MLCLLGTPGLREDDRHVQFHVRPKALALLARIALAGAPVSRDILARELFASADDPRATLRWHLNHLRARLPTALASGLLSGVDGLRYDGPVDAVSFAAAAAQLIDDPDRPDALATLALYRGDLCEGLAVAATPEFEVWLYAEQERLRRDFRRATVAVAEVAFRHGRLADVLEPAARLATIEPYFEEGHLLYIRALEAAGRPAEAEAAYRRYERILRDELLATPDPDVAARVGARPPRPERRLPTDHFVALEDLTLHVVEWAGADPTIVVIHGSGMSAYSMSALAQRFSPAHHVVAPDLRGSGFSDKPPTGYSLEGHARDVAELVATLGVDRPVLLGFSIGGAVATLAAELTSARGLVLLDGIVGPEAFVRNAAAQVIRPLGRFYEVDFGGFDEYLREWRGELARFSNEAERLVEAMTRFELAPVGRGRVRHRGLRAALEETWLSAAEYDTLGALGRVRCPVLIVHGERPWIDGRPYLDDIIIDAQLAVARHAILVRARVSNHPELARDPTEEMLREIERFTSQLGRAMPGVA